MSVADGGGVAVELSSSLDDVQIEETGVEDDNALAMKGIVLLLNNKWDESHEIFNKYKTQSVVMHFGGAFVNYVQGGRSVISPTCLYLILSASSLDSECDHPVS